LFKVCLNLSIQWVLSESTFLSHDFMLLRTSIESGRRVL
jgi:hypothetical protein